METERTVIGVTDKIGQSISYLKSYEGGTPFSSFPKPHADIMGACVIYSSHM